MTYEPLHAAIQRLAAGMPGPEDAGLFGASLNPEECQLVVIPVPWDATVSYGVGTAAGPECIRQASHQLDLEDAQFPDVYQHGISMLPIPEHIEKLNRKTRLNVEEVIAHLENGQPLQIGPHGNEFHPAIAKPIRKVNQASTTVNQWVYEQAKDYINKGKLVAVLGGDHSSPLGLIKALSEHHAKTGIGILHIDAHHDLRIAYEGFKYSHASIMYNALQEATGIKSLVQVGIRDYSRDERIMASDKQHGITTFYGAQIEDRLLGKECWQDIVKDILQALPEHVYVSFDIDGLDPSYCPSTGTPVPGGLSYAQARYLIEALTKQSKKIVGFDLCEVAPAGNGTDEWDANVGARILYKLCCSALASRSR